MYPSRYNMVFTPHIMRRELWKISGHEGFYSQNMYPPMELDDAEYRLKPILEMPWTYPDLQELAAELPRPAGAVCGVGQCVSLRA